MNPDAVNDTVTRDWFKHWFNEHYLALYRHRSPTEAHHQVAFLHEQLQLKSVATAGLLLDVGCGEGRHIAVWRELGLRTIGIDLSELLLGRAQQRLSAISSSFKDLRKDFRKGPRKAPRPLTYLLRADMRALPLANNTVNILTSLFTSFGYFEDNEEHRQVIKEWVRILVPGGKLVIDVLRKEYVRAKLTTAQGNNPALANNAEEKITENCKFLISRAYDEKSGRVIKHIKVSALKDVWKAEEKKEGQEGIFQSEKENVFVESVRVFSESELSALLEQQGLRIEQSFGGFNGEVSSPNAERLILIARK